jgi:hypothetical protein
MRHAILSALLLLASAEASATDFGIRSLGGAPGTPSAQPLVSQTPRFSTSWTLSGAASVAAAWGRVTSLLRSPEHNRRVGGVFNSFHLSGRAIDIGRRPGVRHADIEAALRRAGYRLVESLDEGDHSHFAFAFGPAPVSAPTTSRPPELTATFQWRVVATSR